MDLNLICIMVMLICAPVVLCGVKEEKRQENGNKLVRQMTSSLNKNLVYRPGELCSKQYGDSFKNSCTKPLNILIFARTMPLPTQIGGDKRVFHLLEAMQGMGHRVFLSVLVSGATKSTADDEFLLRSLDISVDLDPIFAAQNPSEKLRQVLQKSRPDVVVMWLWFWNPDLTGPNVLIDQVRRAVPSARVVTFSDDIPSQRELMMAAHYESVSGAANAKKNPFSKKVKRTKNAEKKIFRNSDMVVTVTQSDRHRIVQEDPSGVLAKFNKVVCVRLALSSWELHSLSTAVQDYSQRKDLVFVGNGESIGNAQALEWYLKDLAADVNNGIPGVKVIVIGKGWDAFMKRHKEFAAKYVVYMGYLSWTEMMNKLDTARVFISPMVSSTGISGKNILALTRGIPLVTTPTGAAGLCEQCDAVLTKSPYDTFSAGKGDEVMQMPLLVGRDKWDFILKLKDFYYNADTWRNYSIAAPKHAKRWFDKLAASRDIEDMLTTLATLPNTTELVSHAIRIENEDQFRFRKNTGNMLNLS